MTAANALMAGWMGDIPSEIAARLLDVGSRVSLPAGTMVYAHGASDMDLYGIQSGTARMHIAMNEHEQRVAHICGPGFWFGEAELISESDRIMEVEAAEELVLHRVRSADFLCLCVTFPDLWRRIGLLSVQHLGLVIGAVDDLMLPSAEKRLAAVLLRLSGYRLAHPNSPPHPTIYITQEDLSVATNLSRASAGRLLREMATAGDIEIFYGSLRILNPDALQTRMT